MGSGELAGCSRCIHGEQVHAIVCLPIRALDGGPSCSDSRRVLHTAPLQGRLCWHRRLLITCGPGISCAGIHQSSIDELVGMSGRPGWLPYQEHKWDSKGNVVVMLMNLSSLAAPEVVILTTSGATSDDKFINMTSFPVECSYLQLLKTPSSTQVWRWSWSPNLLLPFNSVRSGGHHLKSPLFSWVTTCTQRVCLQIVLMNMVRYCQGNFTGLLTRCNIRCGDHFTNKRASFQSELAFSFTTGCRKLASFSKKLARFLRCFTKLLAFCDPENM